MMPVSSTTPLAPAAILLCGGRSSRMGQSKALLDWHGKPLIERIIASIATLTDPILVVSGQNQRLPPLEGIVKLTDDQAFPGPVSAFRTGLRALDRTREYCLLLSCDLPLFEPRLLELYLQSIGRSDFAMPKIAAIAQPLCALYRVASTLKALEKMSPAGAGMGQLRQHLEGVFLDEQVCAQMDPALGSFQPCNTPEEFARLVAAKKS